MRDGDWKLLCNYDGAHPELYDLAADRGETTNLAGQHPEIVARLTAAVVEWPRSLPADNGPKLGPASPNLPGRPKKAKAQE